MSERIHADERNWQDGAQRAHLFRYYVAKGFVEKDDHVLDVACGCGYGSEILAEVAKSVVGIDYDEGSIKHAREFHILNNRKFHLGPNHANMSEPVDKLKFEQMDLNAISGLPECDTVVSIETIEHLRDPEKFAHMLKSAARRLIFVTTPIVPTKHANPHHLHDFTVAQIEGIFGDNTWKPFHSYKQGAGPNSSYGGFIYYKK